MSIFSAILQKLGLQKPTPKPAAAAPKPAAPAAVAPKPTVSAAPAPAAPKPAPAAPKPAAPAAAPKPAAPAPAAKAPEYRPEELEKQLEAKAAAAAAAKAKAAAEAAAAEPEVEAISIVDVVAQLEDMAAKNPEKLNWKVSIVDLLKLLGIDSSFKARKELAEELGCPAELMDDSAKMNTWLHKTVLSQIAENGGNIPPELLS